jgi:hypothetical protein
MNKIHFGWLCLPIAAALPIFTNGCAGELSASEQNEFLQEKTGGSGGATGSGGGGGGGGSGTGGGAPMGLMCPDVALVCATAGCHDSTTHQSNLDLTGDIAKYVDKAIDVPTDPDALAASCGAPDSKAKGGKIIDSATPENSLLYTKLGAMFPCGTKMPVIDVGNKWKKTDDVTCVLNWVKTFKK